MWFLVQVVKGSKHYEPESKVGNQVLISDTTEMVISARTTGADDYRFEMRKGMDTFVIRDFKGIQSPGLIVAKFEELAKRMGALTITGDA
jgi:CYTH domain-containing protein